MLDFSQVKQIIAPFGEIIKIQNVIGDTLWQKIQRVLKEWRGLSPLTCMPTVAGEFEELKVYGNSKQGILPDGYTQLEYLSSDSKAYIDTGITGGKDTLEFYCKFSYSKHVNYGAIYGNYISDNNNGIRCILTNNSNTIIINNNTLCLPKGNTELNCSIDNIHTILSSSTKITLDNVVTTVTNVSKGTENNNNIALFNRSLTNPNTSRDIGVRVYEFSIKDNGVLVNNLIPARRNSDGVLGMYDLVTNTFKTNAGTGSFIAGSEAPTPDTPIPVESVGDIKNLFNKDNATNKFGSLQANGNVVYNTGAGTFELEVKPNTTYTLSINNTSTTIFRIVETSTQFTTGTLTGSVIIYGTNEQQYTFTTRDNTKYLYYQTNFSQFNYVKNTLQLEEGSTATPYEPYGYKVPVVVSGKNLFNKNATIIKSYIESSVDRFTPSSPANSVIIKVKPNTTYTLHSEIKDGTRLRCGLADTYFTQGDIRIVNRTSTNNKITFTTNGTEQYCYINILDGDNVQYILDALQLEQGDTATPYEPYVTPTTTNIYLDEPLRKIGTFADTMSVKGNEVTVVRNIGFFNPEKLTNILKYYGTYMGHNLFYFDIGTASYSKLYNSIAPLSNIFESFSYDSHRGSSDMPNYNIRYQLSTANGTNINRIYFNYDGTIEPSTVLNKLNEVNGEIITVIQTPTTETYTLDTPILALDNTSIITVDTTTPPSELYASEWVEE